MRDMIDQLSGLRIIESILLTESGEPVTVRRPWRERLFTKPWRPWQTTRVEIPQVPSKKFYILGNSVVMHPAMARELRRLTEAK